MSRGTRTIAVIALASIVAAFVAVALFIRAGAPEGSTDLPSTGTVRDPAPDPPKTTPGTGSSRGGTGFGRGGQQPAPDRFAEVDEELGRLVTGHVAFNTPDSMRFGETRAVALVASPEL